MESENPVVQQAVENMETNNVTTTEKNEVEESQKYDAGLPDDYEEDEEYNSSDMEEDVDEEEDDDDEDYECEDDEQDADDEEESEEDGGSEPNANEEEEYWEFVENGMRLLRKHFPILTAKMRYEASSDLWKKMLKTHEDLGIKIFQKL